VGKVARMEIYRKSNISVTGRGVVEGEGDKMSDRKMQEKTAKTIDTAHEQSKVVRCSGHGDMDMDWQCEK
jgi:hypothetical protein